MKFPFTKSLRLACLLTLLLATASLSANAQGVRLQLNNLNQLEPKASSSVDVSLDGALLRFAISLLNVKDPKQAQIKDAISGIKGVYVRAYEFDKEGAYALSDVDSVRAQVRAPGWTKMVGVRSNKEGENVEVYMMMTGSQVDGIAVIAADPKSLAVVNMVGTIDLDKLVKLSGRFGIPNLDINIGKDKE
jgi:Domain of unknown function (DUF4252)